MFQRAAISESASSVNAPCLFNPLLEIVGKDAGIASGSAAAGDYDNIQRIHPPVRLAGHQIFYQANGEKKSTSYLFVTNGSEFDSRLSFGYRI